MDGERPGLEDIMTKNKFGVDPSCWKKWDEKQRKLFNGTYDDIVRVGSALFLHPVTVQRELSDDEFQTIAWNAAWTAARMLRGERVDEVHTMHEGRVISIDDVRKTAHRCG